jgi:hypothetical protein
MLKQLEQYQRSTQHESPQKRHHQQRTESKEAKDSTHYIILASKPIANNCCGVNYV